MMKKTTRNISRVVALSLMIALTPNTAAWSQENEANANANAAPQNAWTVNCSSDQDAKLTCRMSQSLIRRDTRQRLVAAVIFKQTSDAVPTMRLALPHGIFFPFGVVTSIDGEQVGKYAVEFGDQNGSYVNVQMAPEFVERMKLGGKFSVAMKNAQQQDFTLDMSLNGFTASYESFLKN